MEYDVTSPRTSSASLYGWRIGLRAAGVTTSSSLVRSTLTLGRPGGFRGPRYATRIVVVGRSRRFRPLRKDD